MADKIIAEYDVYVDNFLTPDQAQKLYVLQYPLRPPWRPYDTDSSSQVKVKPNSRSLQFDIPQDSRLENFNLEEIQQRDISKQNLSSQHVEQGASFALGCLNVSQNKVVLVPVDEMLLMKPNTSLFGSYIESAKGGARDLTKAKNQMEEQKLETQKENEPKLVEMKVKGRENERQEQYRINSYSYQKQLENNEQWIDLQFHPPHSTQTTNNMNKILSSINQSSDSKEVVLNSPQRSNSHQTQPQQASQSCMDPKEYLSLIASQMANNLFGQALGSNFTTGPQTKITKIEGGQLQFLKDAMQQLFRIHSVCSLKNIRDWIEEQPQATRELSRATDNALDKALTFDQSYRQIRGSYVIGEIGTQEIDKIRTRLLDLFENKEGMKKNEIEETFKAIGLQLPNHVYSKVMKDLCYSKGSVWYIKQGF